MEKIRKEFQKVLSCNFELDYPTMELWGKNFSFSININTKKYFFKVNDVEIELESNTLYMLPMKLAQRVEKIAADMEKLEQKLPQKLRYNRYRHSLIDFENQREILL